MTRPQPIFAPPTPDEMTRRLARVHAPMDARQLDCIMAASPEVTASLLPRILRDNPFTNMLTTRPSGPDSTDSGSVAYY